jgi:hypothetical protein
MKKIKKSGVTQAVGVLLILLAAGIFAKKILWPCFLQPNRNLAVFGTSDFAAYYIAAWEVAHGNSPYHRVAITDRVLYYPTAEGKKILGISSEVIPGYIYPPLLAVILQPFTHLEFQTALTLWLLLNCILVLLCLVICIKTFVPQENRILSAGWVSLIVLASMSTYENIFLGQINYVTFFLCLSAYLAFERQRPYLAGSILAAATWLKLTPAFLLIYFLYHKRSWPVLWGFLLVSLILAGWTVAAIGPQESAHYLVFILPKAGQEQLALGNKSFLAMFDRLFQANQLMQPIIALPFLSIPLKAAFISALFYGAHRLRQRAIQNLSRHPKQADRFLYAAALLLMMLCQPIIEIHHLLFAFPALAFLIGHFPANRRTLIGLGLAIIAMMINSRGWNAFAKWSEHWSSVFLIAPQAWGLLFLGAMLFAWINQQISLEVKS